jgi:putative ABC transport system permease protein
VAAAAIFYGIAVFVSTSSFMYSTKQSVLAYLDNVVKAEILVTSGHPLATTGSQNIPMPLEFMAEIGRMPGILSVDPFRKIYIDYAGKRALLLVLDVKLRTSYTNFTVVRGDKQSLQTQLPGRDAVAVNEALAAQYNLKPGDHITIPTPAGPIPFNVAAVIVEYSSDSGTLLIDIGTYQKYWGERLVDTIAVRVKPGEDVIAVRDAIQQKFGSDRKLFVLASWEFKREVRKMLDQIFIFDHLLNIITLTIASLGIIITLLASVLERTREIGILRSIGMLKKQVSRIVILESVLLGVVGGSLGCVAGLILGWMTLEGFYRADYGGSAEFFIPYVSIAWALVMSAGLSALAGIYPARRAAKTNITEALSYE